MQGTQPVPPSQGSGTQTLIGLVVRTLHGDAHGNQGSRERNPVDVQVDGQTFFSEGVDTQRSSRNNSPRATPGSYSTAVTWHRARSGWGLAVVLSGSLPFTTGGRWTCCLRAFKSPWARAMQRGAHAGTCLVRATLDV